MIVANYKFTTHSIIGSLGKMTNFVAMKLKKLLYLLPVTLMTTVFSVKAQEPNGTEAYSTFLNEARENHLAYRITQAEQNIASFRKSPEGKDPQLKQQADKLSRQLQITRNMLDHVQRIIVIDSIQVAEEKFFKSYRLPVSAGKLISYDDFPVEEWKTDTDMAYSNEAGDLILVARIDSLDRLLITENVRLVGGDWMESRYVPEKLAKNGDMDYPFLTSDGTMLYFASDGDESMGGFDIFVSGRDPLTGDYLDATNLGMPINSPANEYMLAIDEENGVGWWATDRNTKPGFLTIYIYKLSDTRENIDPEEEDLLNLASLADYKATWEEEEDYSELLRIIKSIDPNANEETDFILPVDNGKVITRFDDLPNERSRDAMNAYLEAQDQQEKDEIYLLELRRKYYETKDRRLAGEIKVLESKVEKGYTTVRKLKSNVYKEIKKDVTFPY